MGYLAQQNKEGSLGFWRSYLVKTLQFTQERFHISLLLKVAAIVHCYGKHWFVTWNTDSKVQLIDDQSCMTTAAWLNLQYKYRSYTNYNISRHLPSTLSLKSIFCTVSLPQKLVQVFPLISGQCYPLLTSTFLQIQGKAWAELPTGVTSSVA